MKDLLTELTNKSVLFNILVFFKNYFTALSTDSNIFALRNTNLSSSKASRAVV